MVLLHEAMGPAGFNTTVIYMENEYSNFELRCLFQLSGDPATGMINSGIQYRSLISKDNMTGYQADIGEGFWGNIYDEHEGKNS